MSSQEELRTIALREFARSGYGSTSLHRIAEIAGLSKSSVLYHYSSKEALLEAAIAPAIDAMDSIISSMEGLEFTQERRHAFIVQFVDFLLAHRSEVHMFINQARSLEDVPAVGRANEVVGRIAEVFGAAVNSTEDRMRFGMALGGAAYSLVTQDEFGQTESPLDETRAALVTIMTELLAPVSVSPALN